MAEFKNLGDAISTALLCDLIYIESDHIANMEREEFARIWGNVMRIKYREYVATFEAIPGLTYAQHVALQRLWQRREEGRRPPFADFLKTVRDDRLNKCLMVPYLGMYIGIEQDGYTHA